MIIKFLINKINKGGKVLGDRMPRVQKVEEVLEIAASRVVNKLPLKTLRTISLHKGSLIKDNLLASKPQGRKVEFDILNKNK
jgi:hypothetical protein